MCFLPIYFFSYTHFACLSFLVIITVVFMNFSLSFFGFHVPVWCIHHFLLQCTQSPTVNYSDLITVVENQDCVPPWVADGSKAQNIFALLRAAARGTAPTPNPSCSPTESWLGEQDSSGREGRAHVTYPSCCLGSPLNLIWHFGYWIWQRSSLKVHSQLMFPRHDSKVDYLLLSL